MATVLYIIAGCVGYALFMLLIFAICRAAGNADKRMEDMHEFHEPTPEELAQWEL